MQIKDNQSLADYSGMRLGGTAAHVTSIASRTELTEAVKWAKEQNLPVIMVGYGTNIVWRDEGFPGLVIVNKIMGFDIYEQDETNFYVTVSAGENWDSVVERCVDAGLSGIEALSLVPGTTGATPVQNVGAYGQEVAQTILTVEAYDSEEGKFVNLGASDCGFGYRTSRFKTSDHGRFFITSVTYHLVKRNPGPPFYGSLQKYFEAAKITEFTPKVVRDAVIGLRTAKLPDVAVIKNCGSFFTNPIIKKDQLDYIVSNYRDAVHWPVNDDMAKMSAAWLIEAAGFKDFHDPETGMATWPKQALVLVNESAKSTADLLAFKQKIIDSVSTKFGIILEQEPELLP